MIAALAEELSRQAAAADLLHATDVCHSLALDAGGDVLLESCAVAGLHVRVMRQGRVEHVPRPFAPPAPARCWT
jgi:hypothetical protein